MEPVIALRAMCVATVYGETELTINCVSLFSLVSVLQTASSISFCMCYNAHKKKLMITVVKAKSLKMSALAKGE